MKPPAPVPVLLVEDDVDLRNVLTEFLELRGFDVTGAGSGMEFYRILDRQPEFHVAIIDLGLPDQPGQVLADYARRNTRMSVIVITANDTVDNRIDTYRAGADLFIGKPIDSRELQAAVASMAERYRERHGLTALSDGASGPATGWTLDTNRRQLRSPAGSVVVLNPQEVTVLELFCAAQTGTVERRLMLDALYGRDDPSAQRALDNLIRRLRQKINEATGEPAPLLTAYSIGHSFCEPLQVT